MSWNIPLKRDDVVLLKRLSKWLAPECGGGASHLLEHIWHK